MQYYPMQNRKFLVGMIFSLVLLGACSSDSSRDMREFVRNVKARQATPLSALPIFPPYQSFKYVAENLRNPFEPTVPLRMNKMAAHQKGPMPNLNRSKEPLEFFALESLQMVGTLARGDAMYALMRDSKGLIYRVGIGSYIGLNYGQIEKITSMGLEIKEWVLNSKGEWQTRNVPLRFSKHSAK